MLSVASVASASGAEAAATVNDADISGRAVPQKAAYALGLSALAHMCSVPIISRGLLGS